MLKGVAPGYKSQLYLHESFHTSTGYKQIAAVFNFILADLHWKDGSFPSTLHADDSQPLPFP